MEGSFKGFSFPRVEKDFLFLGGKGLLFFSFWGGEKEPVRKAFLFFSFWGRRRNLLERTFVFFLLGGGGGGEATC